MSSFAVIPLSENYNVANKSCEIKDVIITTDDKLIIRTTNITITFIEEDYIDHTNKTAKRIKNTIDIIISGEQYLLDKNVFKYIINIGCYSPSNYNQHTFDIKDCTSILGNTYMISKNLNSFYDKIFEFNIFNTCPNTYHNPNGKVHAKIPNPSYTINDIIDCGVFEVDYIQKLDDAKRKVNYNSAISSLYRNYEQRYDADIRAKETHAKQIEEKDTLIKQQIEAKDTQITTMKETHAKQIEAKDTQNIQLQETINQLRKELSDCKLNEKATIAKIQEDEFDKKIQPINEELKQLWVAIVSMQSCKSCSGNF